MGRVVTFQKRRIKKSRLIIPRGRRPVRARSMIPRREYVVRRGKVSLRPIRHKRRFFKKFASPIRYFNAFRNFGHGFTRIVRSWQKKQTEWSPIRERNWGRSIIPVKKKWKRKKQGFGTDTVAVAEYKHALKRINEQRKHREDIRPKVIKRVDGRGRHNSPRNNPLKGTNKWGPAGDLGPNLVVHLIPTPALINELKKKSTKVTRDFLEHAIKSSIDSFRAKLIEDGEKLIYTIVPEDSETLRKNLLKNLKSGKRHHFSLKMECFTNNLKYAKPVNEMTKKMLQHPRVNRNKTKTMVRSKRTKRWLFDPKAQHHFFSWLYLTLRTKAKKYIRDMIKQIISLTTHSSATKYSIPRQPLPTYTLPKKKMIGYRKFTPKELRQGWYVNIKGKKRMIGMSMMTKTAIGETGPTRKGIKSGDYVKWQIDKQRTREQRLREAHMKKTKRTSVYNVNYKGKYSFYKPTTFPTFKYNTVRGWFKVRFK
jgi:hypothetical protein